MPLPQKSGVEEKLKRAKENIQNLAREVDAFLTEGRYGLSVSDSDPKLAGEAISYHRTREIPPRFSVLAGEALYNLRSCLDRLACILHLANNGSSCERTEFPIYLNDPRNDPKESGKYARKIKMFREVSPNTQALIEGLQPYQPGNNAPNNTLAILHTLNNIDKHRELVVMGTVTYETATFRWEDKPGQVSTMHYVTAIVGNIPALTPPHAVKVDGKHIFQVSIPKIGDPQRDVPLCPLLDNVRRDVANIVIQLTAGY